jgi:hypothetical protein
MYPHEGSLVKRLAGKPFVLLGVNRDDDRDQMKRVVEKEGMTWRSWWDGGGTQGPIQTAYNVSHRPTTYVLDHEGVIRHIDVRDQKLEDAIDELLARIEKKGSQNGSGQGLASVRRKMGVFSLCHRTGIW